MERFEEEKIKTVRPIKNTWNDWLINYIPIPIRNSVSVSKDIFMNLFKVNTPKQTFYGREKKLSKPRKQSIENPFISEQNKEKIKELLGTF